MASIAENLQAVRERIAQASQAAGRGAGSVALIAVSKGFPCSAIAQAHAAGQCLFGESFAQEGVRKVTDLAGETLRPPLEWHFIGPVQGNKTGQVARCFDWVHSVDRERIARRLHDARPAGLTPLNVCIQVNVSGEASKGGVAPGDEEALADAVAALPRLRLRGLMAIPEPTPDRALRRSRFALLRERRDRLVACGHALDALSMGMSADFEDAIAEGATLVRVGTAIFGARERQ